MSRVTRGGAYRGSSRLGPSRRIFSFFFFQAEDGIRDYKVTGVQTCALPISATSTTPGASSRTPSSSTTPIRCSGTGFSTAACATTARAPPTSTATCSRGPTTRTSWRSEEHTSELQSPCNLVCRLLLEKKNKTDRVKNATDPSAAKGDGVAHAEHVSSQRRHYPALRPSLAAPVRPIAHEDRLKLVHRLC